MSFFSTDDEVNALAGRFYAGCLPPSKWDRATQLAVVLYFAVRFPRRMAFEILSSRIPSLWVGQNSPAEVARLHECIDRWLCRACDFAKHYRNIEEISALTNIFIATNWSEETPFPRLPENCFHDADTERLIMPETSARIEVSMH